LLVQPVPVVLVARASQGPVVQLVLPGGLTTVAVPISQVAMVAMVAMVAQAVEVRMVLLV